MRRSLRALSIASLLVASACSKEEPKPTSQFDPPATSASAKPSGPSAAAVSASAIVAQATDGAAFAPFFPAPGEGGTTGKVVRTPKQGSAEVIYKKGSDEYATLLISDTSAAPAVRDDYKSSTDKVDGYPLKTSGGNKSAVLVADRFEVTVSSARLKPDERKVWLHQVDLAGLAKLAK